MRYNSTTDGQFLRKSSLGPVLSATRRHVRLPVPGRGELGLQARSNLSGLGAASSFGPPVGAGAGAGAAIGASQGASIGSAIVPGIGTAIGALVGAIGGAIAGSLNKRDPEQANFDQAVALWQQNPDNVYMIGNKYLALAGLMDLHLKGTPHIPIFIKYNNHGGLGEQKFVNDMTALIYQAAQSGRITANDTPLTVMANIVQPWIDSWGYGPMVDPHADMINRLMVGMIMDYVLGRQGSWTARSGDFPFANIPPFALAQSAQPQTTASQTPSPVATQTAQAPVINQTATSSGPTIAPPIGTPITAAMDDTGTMINIPAGGIYAGKLVPPAIGWLVTYGGTTYHISGGQLIPVQASNSSGLNPALITANAAVATSPPAIGTAISYVKDNTTGQMVAIPAGGTFAGLTSTSGWLVTYPSSSANPGTYASNNGVLTPYNSTAQVTSIPSGFTATAQTALLGGQAYPVYLDPVGNSYIWTGSQMVPYQQAANTGASTSAGASTTSVSTGGGGGGGFDFPTSVPDTSQSSQPLVATASGGIDTNTLLLIGAGVGLLALLGKRK